MTMLFKRAMRHNWIRFATIGVFSASLAAAATFGRVVQIGGQASDLVLDEGRNALYIANYTASRIDVMSIGDNTISRSISVPPYPSSLAISPNGKYLAVTHYASSDGAPLSKPGQNALTIINLSTNQKQTFGLSSPPFGAAFGGDNLALIVTQTDFTLYDPETGRMAALETVSNVASQTLPVPLATSPSEITGGAIVATADGRHILGFLGTTPDNGNQTVAVRFSYNVSQQRITANRGLTSVPSLAPRAISASRDGAYWMTGWALIGCGFGTLGDCTADGPLLAQWPNASGDLGIGSVAIRSTKSLIYAQITAKSANAGGRLLPPNLLVLDADNLAVRERIQIPENLAGRSIFNADESILYSVSDSGLTVFPMAALDQAPRITASVEDVMVRGNFCNGGPLSQQIDIVDPAGNATPFQVCVAGSTTCAMPGVTISPSSGVTPARVKITIDPTVSQTMIGTKALSFELRSAQAINMPPPPARGVVETGYQPNVRARFRVLVNNRVPENRGAVVNVPGTLADVLADPARNRFYVLRQDTNQVLVYDATNYRQLATLRTSNTPTQLAITFDRKELLVGHDNSQLAYRYDLDSLKLLPPIVFPIGHYPRSIAASANGILAASRAAGPPHKIDRVDLLTQTASALPSLGPFKNEVHASTTLLPTPNGANIVAAMPDGNMLLYSASADTFTISRKDFPALKGAFAASDGGYYVVDHYLLNGSLVLQGLVSEASDTATGFAFVDLDGISTGISASGSAYVQRVNADGPRLPAGLAEAPLPIDSDYPFARRLASLANRTAYVQLTTSGFSVLPWNYDAAIAPPVLQTVVSAADLTSPVAPGGLAAVLGSGLSPITMATPDASLPTILADSCLTLFRCSSYRRLASTRNCHSALQARPKWCFTLRTASATPFMSTSSRPLPLSSAPEQPARSRTLRRFTAPEMDNW
jgi:DNA-binding beta-propeller fold protein YncE